MTFDQFKARLRPYRGEIKGVLTRGSVLAGIGNAYSDEILFDARLSPFRTSAPPSPMTSSGDSMRATQGDRILA